jgi:Mg2+-importing ATPase
MVEFGVLSSVFDLLTFAILLAAYGASPEVFRTGWFVESLLTELVIALVVRTRRPFFASLPGTALLWLTVALVAVTILIPYLSFAGVFGFVPVPAGMMAILVGIVIAYVFSAELLKCWFYRS